MKFSGKFLVLTAVLMLVAAPAMADDHLNETDDQPENDSDIEEEDDNETENETEAENDSERDGTDNSTELTVSEQEAERTARAALSNNNWTLEDSSVDEENGYYEFEFVVSGEEAEAEVRVDGSSGEIFRLEEELEKEGKASEEAVQARIEAKQEQIERYRERISELEEEIEQLREEGAVDGSESEAEVEFKRDGNETEVEVEAEQGDREAKVEAEGPNQNAQENVNGTPGNGNSKRPGFVSRMFGGFFN